MGADVSSLVRPPDAAPLAGQAGLGLVETAAAETERLVFELRLRPAGQPGAVSGVRDGKGTEVSRSPELPRSTAGHGRDAHATRFWFIDAHVATGRSTCGTGVPP